MRIPSWIRITILLCGPVFSSSGTAQDNPNRLRAFCGEALAYENGGYSVKYAEKLLIPDYTQQVRSNENRDYYRAILKAYYEVLSRFDGLDNHHYSYDDLQKHFEKNGPIPRNKDRHKGFVDRVRIYEKNQNISTTDFLNKLLGSERISIWKWISPYTAASSALAFGHLVAQTDIPTTWDDLPRIGAEGIFALVSGVASGIIFPTEYSNSQVRRHNRRMIGDIQRIEQIITEKDTEAAIYSFAIHMKRGTGGAIPQNFGGFDVLFRNLKDGNPPSVYVIPWVFDAITQERWKKKSWVPLWKKHKRLPDID